jgi:sucrose phosphorylase
MRGRLERLYGVTEAGALEGRLAALLESQAEAIGSTPPAPGFSERSALLITYGDIVRHPGEPPLATLKRLCDQRLAGAIDTIHVLPFCPSSSDGGFAVIDYRQVAPELGSWSELEAIGRDYRLMADLVLNHCSSQSDWFRNYLADVSPGRGYFIEVDPAEDLSAVVRPRPWPLLTPVETSRGRRFVWTTFSADQVDLRWACPEVLLELVDVLLGYLAHGVRVIRLDAVAFLWKELGTPCIHLPQTHEVVRLLRDLLAMARPDAVLLTETNVPHEENVSYFGDGDEAHMVYQFTLPPLLLHALLRGDSSRLAAWLRTHGEPPAGGCFLNFTASHDGIGLRPLEGLIDRAELEWLVREVASRGGLVSQRSMPDGSKQPYELNVTYRDALAEPHDERLGLARFVASQAIAAALKGVPAFYIHSLVGTENWHAGVAQGEPRDINRRRFELAELDQRLDDADSLPARALAAIVPMLRIRARHGAFHPTGGQQVLATDPPLLGVLRTAPGGSERVLCWFNLTARPVALPAAATRASLGDGPWRDLLAADGAAGRGAPRSLAPYQAAWLTR